MKVEFVGVGEAFEPQLGNSSYLIRSETTLLVDCGYAVPATLFSSIVDPNLIDVVYFTHFHADHTFGFPPVINRWNEDKRRKALTIIGQPGTKDYLCRITDLAYPSCREKLEYSVHFVETTDLFIFKELTLSFAKTEHGMSNYAVKISKENAAVGISGDGGLTEDSRELFRDVRLLIHEAYGFENEVEGHTSAIKVMQFARQLPSLDLLALVHIHRNERREKQKLFTGMGSGEEFDVILPLPGDVVETSSLE